MAEPFKLQASTFLSFNWEHDHGALASHGGGRRDSDTRAAVTAIDLHATRSNCALRLQRFAKLGKCRLRRQQPCLTAYLLLTKLAGLRKVS